MGLHTTHQTRIEAVRIATRVALTGKKAGDTPPELKDILDDAQKLDTFYRSGNVLPE